MNNTTLQNWLRSTGKLRIALLAIALTGKAVQYILIPPFGISKEELIAPTRLLLALDVAWVLFTGVILVECARALVFKRTLSWSLKKHFAVGACLVVLLGIIKVVLIFPRTSMSYHNYGWSLAQNKQYARAMESLDIATYYDRKNLTAYLEKGFVLRELGNFDASLDNFNYVVAVNPRLGDAYAGRGFTFYFLGDHEKALNDWTKAIILDQKLAGRLDRWIAKVKEK